MNISLLAAAAAQLFPTFGMVVSALCLPLSLCVCVLLLIAADVPFLGKRADSPISCGMCLLSLCGAVLQVLEEMQRLIAFRERVMAEEGLESPPVLAVGLSSRKNLCIHPEVSQEYEGQLVDAKCRSMTASWVREQFGAARSWRSRQGGAGGMEVDGGVQLCDFFEEFEVSGKEALLPAGLPTPTP